MSLQPSTIPIQFLGGLDQKRPDKASLPGKFIALENCVRRKHSLVEKRFGLTTLSNSIFSTADTITEGRHLTTFQDDVLLAGNEKLFSYASANDAWVNKGTCSTAQVDMTPLVRNSDTQALSDLASDDGLTVLAWEDSRGGVRYSVYDDTTGAALVYDTLIDASGLKPKVVALRDTFLLAYIVGAALKVRVIAKSAPTTLGAAINIKGSGVASTDYWDIDRYQETYAVYVVSTTTPALEVGYVDQNGVVGSPVTNSLPSPIATGTTAADDFASITGDAMNSKIWILYGGGVEVKAITVSPDFSTTATHTIAAETARNATAVVRSSDNQLLVFYEMAGSTAKDHYIRTACLSWPGTGAITETSAEATLLKSVGLASKSFQVSGNQYFLATHESSLQPTYFVVRHDGTIVARVLGSVGGGLTRNTAGTLTSGLPRVEFDAMGRYATVLQIRNRLVVESGGTTLAASKGLNRAGLTFGASLVTRTLGQNLHIAGGSLLDYDGIAVTEHGFHVYPEDITTATPVDGGSTLTGGTAYSFRVLYEWIDGRGQIHRSAPSVTVTDTPTAGDRIDLTIPTLRLTNRTASSVKIVVYMAAPGLASVYYRKTETANTTATDTVTVQILTNASTTAEILYTTGGVLENIAPPACKSAHVHKNRMWLFGLESDELWYSKEFVTGEAVAFTDFFRMPMEATGGQATCGGSLDDKLIIFKGDRIYYLTGEGPVDTGAQNDYGRILLIASDVGTTIPNSVVETPFGLIFKSSKGFYLLSRSLALKYIGDGVEDFNNLTVTGAVLLADENEARFTTSDGVCLVYNYYFSQWSTFSNYESVSACNGLDTYLYLTADGQVRKEVPGQFEDDGARYFMTIETSWLAFAGLQGFQRIYELALIGDFVSHHYTLIQIAYDYEEAYTDTKYFDTRTGLVSTSVYGEGATYGSATPYGGTGSEVYQFRYAPPRQKCEAIKIRIQDIDTIGTNGGGSVKFVALTAEIGRKSGVYKLGSAKSIGN